MSCTSRAGAKGSPTRFSRSTRCKLREEKTEEVPNFVPPARVDAPEQPRRRVRQLHPCDSPGGSVHGGLLLRHPCGWDGRKRPVLPRSERRKPRPRGRTSQKRHAVVRPNLPRVPSVSSLPRPRRSSCAAESSPPSSSSSSCSPARQPRRRRVACSSRTTPASTARVTSPSVAPRRPRRPAPPRRPSHSPPTRSPRTRCPTTTSVATATNAARRRRTSRSRPVRRRPSPPVTRAA